VSVLLYEATGPAAAVAVVVLPWLGRGRPDRSLVVGALASLGAAALWMLVNLHPDKAARGVALDPAQVIHGHAGWGVVPDGAAASLGVVAVVVGVAIAAMRALRPAWRGSFGIDEQLALGGAALIVLGALPFVVYFYAPLGAGDRVTVVSGVGGAMVWVGLLGMVARAHAVAGAIAAAGLLVLAGVARTDRTVQWGRAGDDAAAVAEGVVAAIPEPHGPVVVGPEPVQRDNIAAYLDRSNVQASLQLAYDDRTVTARLSCSIEEFESADPSLRFDVRPVTRLRPDAEAC
jgi:hypothetical protein